MQQSNKGIGTCLSTLFKNYPIYQVKFLIIRVVAFRVSFNGNTQAALHIIAALCF